MDTVAFRLLAEINRKPGQTQSELARALFGSEGYQQRVNSDVAFLVNTGRLREDDTRRPKRYYPIESKAEVVAAPMTPRRSWTAVLAVLSAMTIASLWALIKRRR